jgi:2-hydroxychromene-2-carboxylate isomerase
MSDDVIELWIDVVCPYAHLASTQIDALAARARVAVRWSPMLLGGVFRAIGQVDDPNAVMPAAKLRHRNEDLARWADVLGERLVMRRDHPRRTVTAMRAICASPDVRTATLALFDAAFRRGEDLEDRRVIAAALDRAGLDGAGLVARADDDDIKADLRARTERAVARGVFGAPGFVLVRGERTELYWGLDRMEQLERALSN